MRLALLGIVAGGLLFAAGCGGDDEPAGNGAATRTEEAGGSPEAGTVDVTLREYSITVEPETAEAGKIIFRVTNDGPSELHEFLVFKTDIPPDDLPTQPDGALDEEGLDMIDELPEFRVGETHELEVDLEPGNYVLACNVGEETGGEEQIHFANGMRAAFTVE